MLLGNKRILVSYSFTKSIIQLEWTYVFKFVCIYLKFLGIYRFRNPTCENFHRIPISFSPLTLYFQASHFTREVAGWKAHALDPILQDQNVSFWKHWRHRHRPSRRCQTGACSPPSRQNWGLRGRKEGWLFLQTIGNHSYYAADLYTYPSFLGSRS